MLRITSVQHLDRYDVLLTLTDGTRRVIDLDPWLAGAVYQPLREDPALFGTVRVVNGALAWPTGQDLDPDALLGNGVAGRVASRCLQAMPAICQFDGMKVYVYGADHNPPHVHVLYASDEALLRIDNGDILEGALPPPQLKSIRKWMTARRAEIALAWVQVQGGRAPDKVSPP